jgi:glycosyltransferase involved in cell wall biosynthesis
MQNFKLNSKKVPTLRTNARIKYLARWSESASIGVIKKIKNTTSALSANGYQAEDEIIAKGGLIGHLLLPVAILFCRADLLIIRSTAFSMLLCSLPMLIQRLRGAKIVIDVPTPLVSVLEEIKGSEKTKLKKIFLRSLVKFNYPLALYPAHRIIQYSEESARFSFGIKGKTILGGNGIDVSSIELRKDKNDKQTNLITLIGVAALEEWHGYDRVIQGISDYYINNRINKINVNFIIVGSGGAETRLKAMVRDLNVTQYVSFKGTLKGEALTDAFNKADLATASLGLHRIGLHKASVLKSREYLARGFPILVSAEDSDIPDTLEFIYKSRGDDSAIDILDLIGWYENYSENGGTAESIRAFAAQNLDYKRKVNIFVNGL